MPDPEREIRMLLARAQLPASDDEIAKLTERFVHHMMDMVLARRSPGVRGGDAAGGGLLLTAVSGPSDC
jgi:hypothetical protein